MALIIALIVANPTLGWAEFYIGAYLGPSFAANVNPNFEFRLTNSEITDFTYHAKNVRVDPAIMYGAKVGYWFTRESIFDVKFPGWLKHFGLEIDFSYQDLDWPTQSVLVTPINQNFILKNNGNAFSISFLLMYRYGFLPDKEVPFGRLQPYVGIGPMVFIATTHLNIGRDYRSTEGDLGFAVETGLRYMVLKNVSVNLAFKYRFVETHVDADDIIFNVPGDHYIPMRTAYHLYDLNFGVAYHF